MLRDTKITKAVINERKELSINILVKEGDYSVQEHELLRIAKIEGNSIDWILEGFEKSDNEAEIKSHRQQLAMIMNEYSTKFHRPDAVDDLYKKYKIKSRMELTLDQLQQEIESYRTAIRTETP